MIKGYYIIICFLLSLASCANESTENQKQLNVEKMPGDDPIEFKSLDIPNEKLIHKGILSPDFGEYYYTISDKDFKQFDVYVQESQYENWSEPKKAFFNSEYDDHGMSFSPDGNTLFFSSTRPTGIDSLPDTWHIWKCTKINGKWSNPEFVNIPNLENKLVSHPSVSNSGTMYFHSSNLDYSDMNLYFAKQKDGKFEAAQKVVINMEEQMGKCTPYISPKEDYLIFATVGDDLDLMVCFKDSVGQWSNVKSLSKKINTQGQGNPYVTPDNKFLFFTVIDTTDNNWEVRWVNIKSELQPD